MWREGSTLNREDEDKDYEEEVSEKAADGPPHTGLDHGLTVGMVRWMRWDDE